MLSPTTVFGLLELQKTPQQERSAVLADFVVKVIADAGTDPNSSVKAFMVHHNNHWSPCVAKVQGPDISLSLTPADYHWMHPMLKAVLGDEIIHIQPVPDAHSICSRLWFSGHRMDSFPPSAGTNRCAIFR